MTEFARFTTLLIHSMIVLWQSARYLHAKKWTRIDSADFLVTEEVSKVQGLRLLLVMWMIVHFMGLNCINTYVIRIQDGAGLLGGCVGQPGFWQYGKLNNHQGKVSLVIWWIAANRWYIWKNKSGPRTVPCGTPDATFLACDSAPSTTTFCIYMTGEEGLDPIMNWSTDAKMFKLR